MIVNGSRLSPEVRGQLHVDCPPPRTFMRVGTSGWMCVRGKGLDLTVRIDEDAFEML